MSNFCNSTQWVVRAEMNLSYDSGVDACYHEATIPVWCPSYIQTGLSAESTGELPCGLVSRCSPAPSRCLKICWIQFATVPASSVPSRREWRLKIQLLSFPIRGHNLLSYFRGLEIIVLLGHWGVIPFLIWFLPPFTHQSREVDSLFLMLFQWECLLRRKVNGVKLYSYWKASKHHAVHWWILVQKLSDLSKTWHLYFCKKF